MLDLGTGGGEFLSSLQNLPQVAYATEGYEPDFPIAKQRPKDIGAIVKFTVDDKIPILDVFLQINGIKLEYSDDNPVQLGLSVADGSCKIIDIHT